MLLLEVEPIISAQQKRNFWTMGALGYLPKLGSGGFSGQARQKLMVRSSAMSMMIAASLWKLETLAPSSRKSLRSQGRIQWGDKWSFCLCQKRVHILRLIGPRCHTLLSTRCVHLILEPTTYGLKLPEAPRWNYVPLWRKSLKNWNLICVQIVLTFIASRWNLFGILGNSLWSCY